MTSKNCTSIYKMHEGVGGCEVSRFI